MKQYDGNYSDYYYLSPTKPNAKVYFGNVNSTQLLADIAQFDVQLNSIKSKVDTTFLIQTEVQKLITTPSIAMANGLLSLSKKREEAKQAAPYFKNVPFRDIYNSLEDYNLSSELNKAHSQIQGGLTFDQAINYTSDASQVQTLLFAAIKAVLKSYKVIRYDSYSGDFYFSPENPATKIYLNNLSSLSETLRHLELFAAQAKGPKGARLAEDEVELLFAANVFNGTGKEGYFALTQKPEGAPDILGVWFNEKTGKLKVKLSDEKTVEVENYKAILLKNRDTGRSELALSLSKNELSLADLKFELTKQTSAVEGAAKGLIAKAPKKLKWDLSGFMNKDTKQTDPFFIEWFVREAKRAKGKGALTVLKGTDQQVADILDMASKLYPNERFIFPNEDTLPPSHKGAKSVTVVAVDPEKEPVLPQGELYLIAQTLAKGHMHNLATLTQVALAEAEVGFEGMTADNKDFNQFRDVYEAMGVKIGDDVKGFIDFTKGIGLTSKKIKKWALSPYKINDILRAYAMSIRMAAQSA